jgi:hypothetical protein
VPKPPVQEAVYNLIGLLEAFGEGEEELRRKLRTALYDLGEDRFPHPDHPDVGERLGEDALPRPLLEAQLAKDASVLQRDRGLIVFAVDLVQAHYTLEQEVELAVVAVGVARPKDSVPGSKAPLGDPDARFLETFYSGLHYY